MKSDEAIKREGLAALKEKLGPVDMEKFIALMNRENFDYTRWRKELLEDLSLEEIAEKADEYSKSIKS